MKSASYVTVKNRGQITIPVEFRNKLNLDEGDILEVEVKKDTIVFKPKEIVDRLDISNAFKEGVAEHKTGKTYGPFNNMREFKKSLKR